MIRRIALVAILIGGCRIGVKPNSAPADVPAPIGAAAPAQFSDLAPGDTAGVVAMMRQTMQQIDSGLVAMTRRDTLLPAVADSVPMRVTLWSQQGVPRKLMVAPDSAANGATAGETDAWFVGGDVAIVQRVTDAYAIEGGRIVLWTDESLVPRGDVTSTQMMQRQAELAEMVGRWMAMFR